MKSKILFIFNCLLVGSLLTGCGTKSTPENCAEKHTCKLVFQFESSAAATGLGTTCANSTSYMELCSPNWNWAGNINALNNNDNRVGMINVEVEKCNEQKDYWITGSTMQTTGCYIEVETSKLFESVIEVNVYSECGWCGDGDRRVRWTGHISVSKDQQQALVTLHDDITYNSDPQGCL
jgi:hypothetical protein